MDGARIVVRDGFFRIGGAMRVRNIVSLVLGAGLFAITVDMWFRAREARRLIADPGGQQMLDWVFWWLSLVVAGVVLGFALAAVGYYYAKGLGYKNPGDWAWAAVFGGETSLWMLMLTGGWKKLARKEVWRDADAEEIGSAWANAHFILFCLFAPAAIIVHTLVFRVWSGS